MKSYTIIYWAVTILFCGIMLMSASMYFFKHEMIVGFFEQLGYPSYIIYPLAIAKILGVIAILSRKSTMLKEWAYAGFFFDVVLALTAHLVAKDGAFLMSLIAIIAIVISRLIESRAFTKQ